LSILWNTANNGDSGVNPIKICTVKEKKKKEKGEISLFDFFLLASTEYRVVVTIERNSRNGWPELFLRGIEIIFKKVNTHTR
jgi:hypothetical protein